MNKKLVIVCLILFGILLGVSSVAFQTEWKAQKLLANPNGNTTTGSQGIDQTGKPGTSVSIPASTVPLPTTTIPGTTPTVTTVPEKSYRMEISLLGQDEVILEYDETYTDAGAEARLFGTDLPEEGVAISDVIVNDNIQYGKTGTYTVVYLAAYDLGGEIVSATVERTVQLVDTQAPVIRLETDPDGFTYPGHAYAEEGFTAFDGHDGDLTDRVQRTEENGVVTYRVTDAAGNTAEVTRTIHYSDPVAPELVLEGEQVVIIKMGKGYVEPGFTATDACDGDITDKVTVTGGEISKYLVGTYTVSYSVQDAAGNIARAERTVIVEAVGKVPDVVQPAGKVIYLTFDDGPSSYTPKLLDILDQYNVKATFFVVNTPYVHYVKDIVERGHAIGVHTATHDFGSIYASEDAYFADLLKMRQIIYDKTGVTTNLMRFPGGSSNTISKFNPGIMTRLTKAVGNMGMVYFDWNVDSNDAGGATNATTVANNVINGCKGRRSCIVLQHDIKGYSVNAVEQIIQWGLENGYTFLPLVDTSPRSRHGINN